MINKRFWLRIAKWLIGTILLLFIGISSVLYFFKDDIISYVIKEVNKNLNAKVEVHDVDITFWSTFPNLSLDFNHVFIQSALPYSTRKDTLLQTDQIRLKFSPFDIWNEEYRVKSIEVAPGKLNLLIDQQGRNNYSILKESKDKTASKFEVTLEEIELRGLNFSYINRGQEQKYSAFFNTLNLAANFNADQFNMKTAADFQIKRIQQGVVSFIRNQHATTTVDIAIDQIKHTVSLPNGKLNLAGLPFNVSVFLDTLQLKANVSAKNLSLEEVANKLSVKEAESVQNFKGSGTVNFNLDVVSPLSADAFPMIKCDFGIKQGKLTEPSENVTLRNINLDGSYSTLDGKGNEKLALENIRFSSVSGPFNGNLYMRKFNAPIYKGNANGNLDLRVIHALLNIPKIDQLSGKVDVNTKFLLQTIQEENGSNMEIIEGSGTANLNNVSLQLTNDSRIFERVNGKLILNKQQASLENLSVKLDHSDLLLNGLFDHIDGFLQDKSNLDVQVVAQSTKINLADFTNTTAQPGENEASKEWMLPSKIAGSVRLDIGTIQLNQHLFTAINGNLTVSDRAVKIEQLHGITANATLNGTLSVLETTPEYFEVATSLTSKDIYFKPIFREWNNFDQTVITEKNISGRAEAVMDMRAAFDARKGIMKDEIRAQIKLKVYEGKLTGVSTFKQLTKDLRSPKTRLALSKRDIDALDGKLDNISFSTLENTIYIKNSTVYIPKMEIKTNALDISTEGTHSFDNQIDYKFAFRFRELKTSTKDAEFGEVIDDGTGIKIFVRMFGNLDNPTIEWDKTARKEQAKENREIAKKEAVSILKTEFGLFKKDTTIQKYQPKIQQREELKIEFGKEEEVNPYEEKKKTNKTLKAIKEKTAKLKPKETKEEIIFE